MKDKQFFNKNEQNDYDKLIQFNRNTKLFNKIERTEEMSTLDAYGEGKNGKLYAIELKSRNYDLQPNNDHFNIVGDNFSSSDIFIESHKLCSLLLEEKEDKTPLYVNFYKNNYTSIHNISTISKPEQTDYKSFKSAGYNGFEIAKRYLLNLDEATIFNNKYKIVQRYKK